MRPCLFVAFGAVFMTTSLAAALCFTFATWSESVIGCRTVPVQDTFLAYCEAPHFAYYEHGAFYLDLEPEATDALRRAQVIVFGSSRAQFAFSNDTVRNYFRTRSVPFYSLGFSYEEGASFAEAIIEKEHLSPKVVIIVADPFFDPTRSSPVSRALIDPSLLTRFSVWYGYVFKKLFTLMEPGFCSLVPSACPEDLPSIYRIRSDGTWIWKNLWANEQTAVPWPDDRSKLETWPVADAFRLRDDALQFLRTVDVAPNCAVITAPPNGDDNFEPYVNELGSLIGANVITPHVFRLVGVDKAHMNEASSNRWSSNFLEQFERILYACVPSAPQPPAGQ